MVLFEENPEQYDSLPMVQVIEGQLQRCVELQKKLATFDRELTLDPRYIHRVSQFSQLVQNLGGGGREEGVGGFVQNIFLVICV